MNSTKKRQYEINMNQIVRLDIITQIYKIVITGLIIAVLLGFFIPLMTSNKTTYYFMVGVIACICMFYVLLYLVPRLDRDNYNQNITLYERKLSKTNDIFDLTVNE